jgi:ADP-heptose:LPS heptosyltransferase
MHKLLLVRFSSIGDIVLTTPVIRCLKEQLPGVEVHFLTRTPFADVLKHHPLIDKVWLTDGSLKDVLPALKAEKFTEVIDLHRNARSLRLKLELNIPHHSFDKVNIKKWLMVNLKWNLLPPVHIVHRYLGAVRHLHVVNDGKGLDYFISAEDESAVKRLPEAFQRGYAGIVIGAAHATKMFPVDKIIAVLKQYNQPAVLLGGVNDKERGDEIAKAVGEKVYNACGNFKLNESAALVKHAKVIMTNDTGLMHIAAAFRKPVVSLWGNTIPEFGMWAYEPEHREQVILHEVKNLSCRPCSKIGFDQCPKGHFRCMRDLDDLQIVASLKRLTT